MYKYNKLSSYQVFIEVTEHSNLIEVILSQRKSRFKCKKCHYLVGHNVSYTFYPSFVEKSMLAVNVFCQIVFQSYWWHNYTVQGVDDRNLLKVQDQRHSKRWRKTAELRRRGRCLLVPRARYGLALLIRFAIYILKNLFAT